jgi:hypothetical protein
VHSVKPSQTIVMHHDEQQICYAKCDIGIKSQILQDKKHFTRCISELPVSTKLRYGFENELSKLQKEKSCKNISQAGETPILKLYAYFVDFSGDDLDPKFYLSSQKGKKRH